MSGHNKWSKVKNVKGKEDAKRAKFFTKMARMIMVAVKEGGPDPAYNPQLRMAIEKAKADNMPNDNIDRAIKKGSGELGSDKYEEIVYEGYGPNGVAILVECLTDNRNRTAANVRHHFDKFGGKMGTNGSVSFMFNKLAVFGLKTNKDNYDDLSMFLLENNAEDIQNEDDILVAMFDSQEYFSVKTILEDENNKKEFQYELEFSEIKRVPQNYQKVESENEEMFSKLLDAMDEDDDVQEVWHNATSEE